MKVYKTLDNGISIVEYEDSLAGAIADMWNKSSDSWGGGSAIDTAEQIIAQHAGSSFFNVYIALFGNEAVGYCSFSRYYKDADTLYIPTLNVRPDFHGKKVGKELVLMCVDRTIELGYARLDIHTWPGNTKAVPLYKKCGYFWEDRADSTHLSNFIPTVLGTELTKGFFEKASWYYDSTRKIEVRTDGVKVNGFEVYKYSWEKDGEILEVGFEHSGRRMRLVETSDYKIEFIAEAHKLAFGLRYGCKFDITNKTGKELDIEINGKDDGIIRFGYSVKEKIEGQKTFNAEFFVGETSEEQDVWRMHPCVLADICINGKSAEFGLGIEAKLPLGISIKQLRHIPQIGMKEECYISITSAFNKDASVSFSLPKNKVTGFSAEEINVEIKAGSKACVKTVSEVLGYGHEGLPIKYNIRLEDGKETSFEKILHIDNRGLTASFAFESDNYYTLVNGPWALVMDKKNNNVNANSLTGPGSCGFTVPKLGKPYQDEFDIIKPAAVKMYRENDAMIMEVMFVSEKQPGIEVTEIFTLTAIGIVTRRLRVKNTSNGIKSMTLKDEFILPLGYKTAFPYAGGIIEATDGQAYGLSFTDTEKIDENWIFEKYDGHSWGMYWPPEYKLNMMHGRNLFFEHKTGELDEGGVFETQPVVSVSNVFYSFNDLRNYVLKTYNRIPAFASDNIEFALNGYNPVVSGDTVDAAVRNLRNKKMEGRISVSSPDGMFDNQDYISEEGNTDKEHVFSLKTKSAAGVYTAELDLSLAGYELKRQKVLLLNHGDVVTNENDGIYEVSNGVITFKASLAYSDGLYSLVMNKTEFLYNRYPKREPYSWWNPFIGGAQSMLSNMSASLTARENITANFASQKDCFGNIWTGLAITVDIEKFEEHKGVSYTQYFLTLGGLPVLCCFTRLYNNTGQYKTAHIRQNIFVDPGESLKNLYCEGTTKERISFRNRMGTESAYRNADKLIKFTFEGRTAREHFYMFKDTGKEGFLSCDGDNKTASGTSGTSVNVENGKAYATRPVFAILSGKELTKESCGDLGRIVFDSEDN